MQIVVTPLWISIYFFKFGSLSLCVLGNSSSSAEHLYAMKFETLPSLVTMQRTKIVGLNPFGFESTKTFEVMNQILHSEIWIKACLSQNWGGGGEWSGRQIFPART